MHPLGAVFLFTFAIANIGMVAILIAQIKASYDVVAKQKVHPSTDATARATSTLNPRPQTPQLSIASWPTRERVRCFRVPKPEAQHGIKSRV
eukprot:1747234-Rhodomonas_salina.1